MNVLNRDPQSLSSREFDLLVIGGGINGAACAWDAALRGFSCVLIEKGDFGGGASAGCFKIVHGGLRYLQHFDISRLRESVEEQRVLRRIAGHFVHPLPFLVPAYGFGQRGKAVLAVAMRLYEYLASERNAGVGEYHLLPPYKSISKEQCLEIAPGLNPRGLRGGVIYYDCQMSNCERLGFSVVRAAAEAGAKVCNYLEAEKLVCLKPDGVARIDHIVARDGLDGREYRIRAKLVVNATGVWSPLIKTLLPESPQQRPLYYSKGVQLVTKQLVRGYGLAVESRYPDPAAKVSRGGRSFFIHPWRGASLIGTSDTIHEGSPDSYRITLRDIRQLLEDVRGAYKDDSLIPANVQFAFGGLRPLEPTQLERLQRGKTGADGEAKAAMEDVLIDHAQTGNRGEAAVANMISVLGVKYTTFRRLAERVVDLVSSKLEGEWGSCATKETPIFGGEIEEYRSFLLRSQKAYPRVPPEVLGHLVRNYGTGIDEIVRVIKQRPDLARLISKENETLAAELVYAARSEMVCTLGDAVLRRTALGTLGSPAAPVLREAAALIGAELGWNEVRCKREVEETAKLFGFAPE